MGPCDQLSCVKGLTLRGCRRSSSVGGVVFSKEEFAKAYQQWDSRLRIALGAISLISLGYVWLDGGLGPVVDLVVRAYRDIFHTIFNAVFSWLLAFFPDLAIPYWIKDFAIIYSIVGSALVSAIQPAFDERLRATAVLRPVPGMTRIDASIDRFVTRRRRFPRWILKLAVGFYFVISWPFYLSEMRNGLSLVQIRSDALPGDNRSYDYYYHIVVRDRLPKQRSLSQRIRIGYELNTVMLLQLLGVLAVAIILVALSAGLEVSKSLL